jgi:hypothetical protein
MQDGCSGTDSGDVVAGASVLLDLCLLRKQVQQFSSAPGPVFCMWLMGRGRVRFAMHWSCRSGEAHQQPRHPKRVGGIHDCILLPFMTAYCCHGTSSNEHDGTLGINGLWLADGRR